MCVRLTTSRRSCLFALLSKASVLTGLPAIGQSLQAKQHRGYSICQEHGHPCQPDICLDSAYRKKEKKRSKTKVNVCVLGGSSISGINCIIDIRHEFGQW